MKTNVQQTSIDAYHTLGGKQAQCEELYSLYLSNGNLTDRLAAALLGWFPSEVSARRNDLIKDGRIISKGEVKSADTGKTVKLWGLTNTLF